MILITRPGIEPAVTLNVDLNQRCFLFPDGKVLTQLRLSAARGGGLTIEALFLFNQTRVMPWVAQLPLNDARDFARRLTEAVYRAQTMHVVSETTRITINVITNGYLIQFGDPDRSIDLFLSTGVIWRLCGALLRVLDQVSPIMAH